MALQQALASEKKLGALAIKKSAEVQERLRKEVEVEVKKAVMLQEELEAATMCLEVRKEDHAKREAEWKAEKSRLQQALKAAGGSAKSETKSESRSKFLRTQLSQAQQRLENQRAAHGREIALLRKELQLEQRRRAWPERELTESNHGLVTRRGSKRDLAMKHDSPPQDRVRKEMDEAH